MDPGELYMDGLDFQTPWSAPVEDDSDASSSTAVQSAAVDFRAATAIASHPTSDNERSTSTERATRALQKWIDSGSITTGELREAVATLESLRAQIADSDPLAGQIDGRIAGFRAELGEELEPETTSDTAISDQFKGLYEQTTSGDRAATNRSVETEKAINQYNAALFAAQAAQDDDQRVKGVAEMAAALQKIQALGVVDQHDIDERLGQIESLRLSIPAGHSLEGPINDAIEQIQGRAKATLAEGLDHLNEKAMLDFHESMKAAMMAENDEARGPAILNAIAALKMLQLYGLASDEKTQEATGELRNIASLLAPENPLRQLIAQRLEEIEGAPKSAPVTTPGTLGDMQKLFRDRLEVIGKAMHAKTADWKKGLETVKAFQRYQVLIGEYANEKEFDYSDRTKFPELNALHDKMEASGIFKWNQRGWSKGEGKNYSALKTNLGLAVQIAMSTNKQDEIDASNMMNAYSTAAMFQMQTIKMIYDLMKFIIRAMSG